MLSRVALLVLLLLAVPAPAQVVPDRELEIARALFEAGKYADALKRARDAMGMANFTDAQRVKLHEIAGVSAFNLGDTKGAQQHFLQLLQLNPDAILDPFAVPPPAIKLFEQVRKDNADALNLVRQQIALKLEQEKRAAAERERLAKEQEERRKRLDEMAKTVTTRTVTKHPFLINFVPFGAGQFEQGRIGWGIAFAASEAVTAVLSIVSYFAIESLYENYTYEIPGRLTADGSNVVKVTVRRIPPNRRGEFEAWRAIKLSSGIAFYALWGAGIGDAIWHHQGEVVSETKKEPALPAARLEIFPTPGGIGAGVSIGF